jgi:hypothetical protein
MRLRLVQQGQQVLVRSKGGHTLGFSVWPILLTAILLVIYLRTLLPGIGYTGDTTKFQFIGRVLGTPHSTGYPTYLVLNHLFTRVFLIGSLAYRANLLSALLSVAASVILFHTLTLLDLRSSVAFIASLAFGLTYTLWSQSVVAEVYTLNLLFINAVLFYLIKWHKTGSGIYFYAACACYALSFGNHLTMITFLPAIVYLVWHTDWTVLLSRRRITIVGSFVIVGALQYLYLLWRAADPGPTYVEIAPTNLSQLWYHVSGGRFREYMFCLSLSEFVGERVPMLAGFLLREFHLLIIPAIVGLIVFRQRTLNLFLLLCLLGSLAFALNYDVHDVFVFFIPSYLVIAIYLAKGLDWIASALTRRGFGLLPVLYALIPIVLFAANFDQVDQSHNVRDAALVEAALDAVGKDGIIISSNYDYTQFLQYHLIGQGVQEEKNIYMQYYFSLDEIRAYICQNTPIYVESQRIHMPTGLTVYVIMPEQYQREALDGAGFRLRPMTEGLYRVEDH